MTTGDMAGSGCHDCPVRDCDTLMYRGSRCAALRNAAGLGDPMTNAERIRQMSDDELCHLLLAFELDEVCITGRDCTASTHCSQCIMDWLREPAEEKEN